MSVGRLIPLLLVLAPLVLPAGAAANDLSRMIDDYRVDGRLDGCYKPLELHNAQQNIPPDVEQYSPGFGDALASAQCSTPGAPAEEESAPAPVSAGTPGPGAPAAPTKRTVKEPPAPKEVEEPLLAQLPQPDLAPLTAGVASETPGALVALLIAAGIALLLALGWALAWALGWSPERFTRPLTATFESIFARR